jgi:Flp pilus assembly protein TadG
MRSKNEQGQAVVEISLILLLFILMIFGITEFARVMYTYNTLVQCTRAAARWAVVNNVTSVTSVKNVAVYGNSAGSGDPLLSGLTPSNVVVSVDVIEYDSSTPPIPMSQKISVRITGYQFRFIVPIAPNITVPGLETSLYTESLGAIT